MQSAVNRVPRNPRRYDLVRWLFPVLVAASFIGNAQTPAGTIGAGAPLAANVPSVNLRHGDLGVSKNRRYLVHADGTPFFYLADTAWELFHRLTREEAVQYLENRRQKRFTVIQATLTALLPNPHGNPDTARMEQINAQGTPNAHGTFLSLTTTRPGRMGLASAIAISSSRRPNGKACS
jgi:hypothetical protein